MGALPVRRHPIGVIRHLVGAISLAAMLRLTVHGRQETLAEIGTALEECGALRHAALGDGAGAASFVWTEVLGQARTNALPVARYLVFMLTAGVIAAFGIVNVNG